MSDLKLSARLRLIVDRAESQAKRHGHGSVTPLHIYLALDQTNDSYFTESERSAANAALKRLPPDYSRPVLSEESNDMLRTAVDSDEDQVDSLLDLIKTYLAEQAKAAPSEPGPEESGDSTPRTQSSGPAGRGTHPAGSARDKSTSDQTEESSTLENLPNHVRKLLAPVPTDELSVPRAGIVHRILSMLGAAEPQHVLLVGPEGGGRTSVAQAIASTISDPDYIGPLAGSPVWITQTAEIGDQPQRLGGLAEVDRDQIVFVDDVEILYPLGRLSGGGQLPVFRTLLGGRGPRLVLAITEPDVDALASADPELLDEFEVVHLPPMSGEEVSLVASEAAARLAEYHGVKFPEDVVAAAAAPPRASDSHSHPALAVRRLDRAGAAATMREDQTVQAADLGTEVARQQYVAFDPERARAALGEAVLGQEKAISEVTERLAITRASLDLRPERPDGVFLFAGPSGTGKTELARTMAREVLGSEETLIRLDMSEFSEEHTVSRLIGSPPGYVGSTEPSGWLTTKVRQRPQALLLLDEFEKSHPRVWNTFLQVFDSGKLTDSQGNVADFRDTIIVLTSNIGARAFTKGNDVGFLPSDPDPRIAEEQLREEIKRTVAPELLNRLDGILVFRPLAPSVIRKIARKNINEALSRVSSRGILADITDSVEDAVCEEGFSPEYGARPLQRAVERLVIRPLIGLPPGRYLLEHGDGATVARPLDNDGG